MRQLTLLMAGMLTAVSMYAQQATLNLEGVIRDETTGQPVGCKVFIFTPSEKRITLSSNSKDGSYLQTLSEAGKHRIVMSGYNIMRKEVFVEMPASQKFKTIKQDFAVRALVEGTVIATVQSAFERNASQLTSAGQKAVLEAADLLRANQEMNIVFNVAPDEDQLAAARNQANAAYKKEYDAWTKAVKKTKKGQTPPPEPVRPADPADPNDDLVASRMATIKALIREKDVKAGDVRVKYSAVPLPVAAAPSTPVAAPETTTKKGKKSKPAPAAKTPAAPVAPAIPSLVVKVGAVKKLYD